MTKKDMTFQRHVLELRKRLLIVLITVAVFSVGGYFAFPYFFDLLQTLISEELYVTKIYEAFLTRLRIAVLVGIFCSIPVLIYHILAFVLPGLYRNEKILVFTLVLAGFLLFVGGVLFSLKLVLPLSIDFLKSEDFFPSALNRIISYDTFLIFFLQFLVAFGLCLQFPIVVLILLYYRVISLKKLISFFKFFVAGTLLFAGILTPPDVVSQIMLTVPMIILYLLCIVVGKLLKWGKPDDV
jgi:sec-independent protein translocase protein TatC